MTAVREELLAAKKSVVPRGDHFCSVIPFKPTYYVEEQIGWGFMTREPDLTLVLISPLGINQPRLRKGGCSEKEEGISIYKSISHVTSEKVEAQKKRRGHLAERRRHERGGLFPIVLNSHIR
ncbi:hypothetical protein CEXT_198971 [Caerostris extrusa]|uniref:Uncharacterized protein n=1 Tax=Caerostris extrusa TaxID=172846 RepID=A0AAV4WV77_CAEEX|nr:hypothetical protein CEXT_198971 [Caerostris extrusa]